MKCHLTINGQPHDVESEPEQPLLWVLRDARGMVGTRLGCGVGQCGACTVTVDGVARRACHPPVSAIGQAAIETIESSADAIAQAL